VADAYPNRVEKNTCPTQQIRGLRTTGKRILHFSEPVNWTIILPIFYWAPRHILEYTAIGDHYKQRDFTDCLQCSSPVVLATSNEFPYREPTSQSCKRKTGHCVFQAITRPHTKRLKPPPTHRVLSQSRGKVVGWTSANQQRTSKLTGHRSSPSSGICRKAFRILYKHRLVIFGLLRFIVESHEVGNTTSCHIPTRTLKVCVKSLDDQNLTVWKMYYIAY